MIPLLGLLHHSQVVLQIRLVGKGGAVDSGQHLILLAASPVSACNAGQLKGLYALGVENVGACAQIRKLSLGVEADGLTLRQILNQFYLVGLILLLHQLDSLVSWQGKGLNRKIFLHDLCHLRFQLLQILRSKTAFPVKIIIKSVVNGRSNGQLCLRVQALHRLCQHMGGRVAQHSQLVLCFLDASVR